MDKLLDMLPELVKFVNHSEKKSIMSHIYGIYKIKLSFFHSINLILQKNCMHVSPGNKML